MQLQVREKDSRSVWYNTVTGEFIVSSPSCSVRRDKYDGAMALYNTWIDSDEKKESKIMDVELTNNNITITEKENTNMENNTITLDKINDMIKQYVLQELDAKEVDIDHYLDTVEDEDIFDKLEEHDILHNMRQTWERQALVSTDFNSIDDLIDAYNNAIETLENVASSIDSAYNEIDSIRDEVYDYI